MKTILESHNHTAPGLGASIWIRQSTLNTGTTLTLGQLTVCELPWFLCDSTTAAFVITLPTAASTSGVVVQFKDNGHASSHPITINVSGGGNIDGGTSLVLGINYTNARVTSDGTQWWQLN